MSKNSFCVDIGNSRISIALFVDDALKTRSDFRTSQVELAAFFVLNKIKKLNNPKIFLSSVVPATTMIFKSYFADNNLNIIELTNKDQKVIKNTYPTLGIDRICNAAGSLFLYPNYKTIAIFDFGSATTLTVVDRHQNFQGGLITLGLSKTLRAIDIYLDQLPQVELDNLMIKSPLAFDTDKAIANGVFLGLVGTVEIWINTVKKNIDSEVFVIGTGGFINVIHGFCPNINVANLDLTLHGINFIGNSYSDDK